MHTHRRGIAKPAVVALLFVLAAAGMWIGYAGIAKKQPASGGGPDIILDENEARRTAAGDLTVADFSFRDEFGRPVTELVLDDRWTLVSFGFTHCQLACPPMHANIMRLQAKLANTPVRFITFSVDPVHDTPARLNEYMRQRGTLGSSWTFLATEEEGLRGLLGGLGMTVFDDTSEANVIDLGDGLRMNNIGHPTRFVLVGPDRGVVDMYEGEDMATVEKTAASIRSHMFNAEQSGG